MIVGVLTTGHLVIQMQPHVICFCVGLRQGWGLCSSSSRKYPETEGTNQNRHWNHHRWNATNIFYLNINQLDALNFIMKFISCLYMFRAHVLIVRRSKLYYTVSGIITGWERTWVISQPVHRTATYRCDDTRCCIVQFWPPNDEHFCSKHVEAWSKLIIKFSASSCLTLR